MKSKGQALTPIALAPNNGCSWDKHPIWWSGAILPVPPHTGEQVTCPVAPDKASSLTHWPLLRIIALFSFLGLGSHPVQKEGFDKCMRLRPPRDNCPPLLPLLPSIG